MSYGQRQRRVLEVAIGVAVGVFVADVFVQVVGTGPWQIAAVVLVSMARVAARRRPGARHAGGRAGLVVAGLPPTPGQAFARWTDALIGGGVALVAAAVVPQAPLRRPRVAAAEAVRKISELLRGAEASAGDGDVEQAAEVLASARGTESLLRELQQGGRRGAVGHLELTLQAPACAARAQDGRARRAARPGDAQHPGARAADHRLGRAGGTAADRLPGADARARRRRRRHRPGLGGERLAGERALGARSRWPSRRDGCHAPRAATETVLAQLRSVVVDLLQVTGLDVDDAVAALPPERPRS